MSWSWKKRSSLPDSATSAVSEEHSSNARNFSAGDDAATRWKQGEERIRELNARLSTALLDVTSKEAAARQHERVAEEAVSGRPKEPDVGNTSGAKHAGNGGTGWEKAGAEAEASKRQLEDVLRENSLLQDRLSQLDAALKDCTRQVRLVREEQEQKRQELLQKKNKELDKFRTDYEAKLADVGRQLLEAGAENKVMAMSLQEHSRTIGELTDARSRAEAEMKLLRHHIESADKDKSALKYEIHVLNKEIQIRNEERNYSRRDMETANRQHIEDAKKINRLEAECQKLRILVRRKLPGPNALAQMKMEVESLDSYSLRSSPDVGHYKLQHNGNREVELLLERVLSMEEETKMLKEALAQRNEELHSSRLMCAKSSSKLSAMEAYFDSVRQEPKVDVPEMVTGSENEVNCADAWASALIAELSQFKNNKLPSNGTENGFLSPALSIMDDFADMERLAMGSSDDKSGDETPNKTPAKEVEAFVRERDQQPRKCLNSEVVSEQEEVVKRAIFLLHKLADATSDDTNPALKSSIQVLNGMLNPVSESKGNWRQAVITELLRGLNSLMPATMVEGEPQTPGNKENDKVELEMLQIEKKALEADLKAEVDKVSGMETEVLTLKAEKADLQAGLDTEILQLEEAHKLIEELKAKLDSNKEEALVLSEVAAQARSSGTLMQDVVARLERELEEEYKNHQEAETTIQEEENHVLQPENDDLEDDRSQQKNQEIAEAGEKLAECQRTIFALGEQLKALSVSSPHESLMNDSRLGVSSNRMHSDGEAEELRAVRDRQRYSPGRSPSTGSRGGRMFEELGLSSPLDLTRGGNTSPRAKDSFSKHKRSSFSRFFVRSTKTTL